MSFCQLTDTSNDLYLLPNLKSGTFFIAFMCVDEFIHSQILINAMLAARGNSKYGGDVKGASGHAYCSQLVQANDSSNTANQDAVRQCCTILDCNWWCILKHTYCKGNRVIDWVANHWCSYDFGLKTLGSPPRGGKDIQIFTDPETSRLMGLCNFFVARHVLTVENIYELLATVKSTHWSCQTTEVTLIGWLDGFWHRQVVALASSLAVMKKSSKLLPVIGWSMWFSEYLFLERSWAKDESTLKSGLQRLQDYPLPFWLALFVEGTRFTQAKLLAAQEYASSTGLPVPRNLLIPRTKGFVSAVSHMRSFVPAIYDVTVAIPKYSPQPTMLRLFKGQSSVVHVHIKRHLMKDLPESDDDVAQWCRDIFVAKDALLDKHKVDDTFGDQHLQHTGRPLKSLVVVCFWACILILGAVKFLQWSSLLSSWKGIAFSVASLGVITFLMHILILFTQSERSTPAKIAPSKQKNGGETTATKQGKQH
ncbi:1-acyl-sn-glycerol-3-phosphate acyltransferase 2 [Ancistrocladus abbreviatus]